MSSNVPWAPSKRIFLFSFIEVDINNEVSVDKDSINSRKVSYSDNISSKFKAFPL